MHYDKWHDQKWNHNQLIWMEEKEGGARGRVQQELEQEVELQLPQSGHSGQNWAAFKRVKVQNHHDITRPREDWSD